MSTRVGAWLRRWRRRKTATGRLFGMVSEVLDISDVLDDASKLREQSHSLQQRHRDVLNRIERLVRN